LSGSTFAPFSINLFRGLCGSCFCRNPGSGGPRLRVLICQTSSTFCRVGAALDDPLPLSSRTPLPGVERLTKRGLQWVPTADSCEASIRRDRTSWRRAATLLLVGWGGYGLHYVPVDLKSSGSYSRRRYNGVARVAWPPFIRRNK
jgi:hypothetical protein